MKIAILGYSRQGRSAYDYWNTSGNQLVICDKNSDVDIPAGAVSHLGPDYLSGLEEFDILVRTPALHPRDIVAANPNSPTILDKVTTDTNEFMRVCPSKQIIGVTGTKGKGTTSTLITRILEAAGKRVILGGNIGIAPTELLIQNIQPSDWVVLELANFQLIDLKYSPHIAVCLLIEPEHLDWHTDMAEYVRAKSQIFVHQKSDDTAIYYADNADSKSIASQSPGAQIPYLQAPGAVVTNNIITIDGHEICPTSELKLLGKHNWQNVCAAITACWLITQDVSAIKQAVTSFSGLPHRIEPVRTVNQVIYYNDSFATGPPATMAALDAIPESKVLIAGGFDRGLNLEEFCNHVLSHNNDIRKALLIGASAKRLAAGLEAVGFTNFEVTDAKNFSEIVKRAQELAQPGDAVLLSPGFASFDMFKDFEERGLLFKEAVMGL